MTLPATVQTIFVAEINQFVSRLIAILILAVLFDCLVASLCHYARKIAINFTLIYFSSLLSLKEVRIPLLYLILPDYFHHLFLIFFIQPLMIVENKQIFWLFSQNYGIFPMIEDFDIQDLCV